MSAGVTADATFSATLSTGSMVPWIPCVSQDADMLPGERPVFTSDGALFLTDRPFCQMKGSLILTNFEFKFHVSRSSSCKILEWMQERRFFNVPHGAVEALLVDGQRISDSGEEQFRLRLQTKDMRSLTFWLAVEAHVHLISHLFCAFAYASSFPARFFAFEYAAHVEPQVARVGAAGWQLYDPQREYARMGVDTDESPKPDCPWTLSDANVSFSLCSTYPAWIVVPRAMNEVEKLQAVAACRARGRLPVMSWCGGARSGFASLWRSSQPLVGTAGTSLENDMMYLLSLHSPSTNAFAVSLLVIDARTKEAASRNKANGGGVEDYDGCRVEFGGIANIIVVRDAWRALSQVVGNACRMETGSWWTAVCNSDWYDLAATILRCVRTAIEELETYSSSVLIHCSDGRDRTSQLTALTMLCMDAQYRTVLGFLSLVQKEFCSFGHKFRSRMALGEEPTSNYSPIFLQWLECAYQVLEQYPRAFEFTQALLLDLGAEVLSNRYGTFLTDSEQERFHSVQPHTLSCWSVLAEIHGGEKANKQYSRVDDTLRPSFCQPDLRVWHEYWFQYHCL